MQGTFAALWGTHHLMHMLWGKLVVGMGPSIVSTSMGAAVAALNFGLNFAISQVVPHGHCEASYFTQRGAQQHQHTSMRSIRAALCSYVLSSALILLPFRETFDSPWLRVPLVMDRSAEMGSGQLSLQVWPQYTCTEP